MESEHYAFTPIVVVCESKYGSKNECSRKGVKIQREACPPLLCIFAPESVNYSSSLNQKGKQHGLPFLSLPDCLSNYFRPTVITPACSLTSLAYPDATTYLSHSLGSKTSLPLLSDLNAAIVVVPRLHS